MIDAKEKKSILMICSSSQNIYTFRLPLIRKFEEEGYAVYVSAFDDDYASELKQENVNFYCVKDSNRDLNPFKILSLEKRFYQLITKLKPDIVFTFMLKPNVFGVRAAHKAKINYIFSMVEGLGDPFNQKTFKQKIIRRIVSFLYKSSLRFSRKVFFLNDEDINDFLALKLVQQSQIVKVTSIGVDLQKFAVEPFDFNSNRFIMAARLLKNKGVFEFCKCAELVQQKHPEAEFYYLGPEAELKVSDIEEYIKKGTIVYCGNVKDVRPYIKSSLMLLLLSKYREGVPMSIVEAEACGRGIITSDNVGCKDTVVDGYNGYMISVEDYELMAAKCEYILEHKEVAYQFGQNARKYAEKCFDADCINETIYSTICDNDTKGN